MRNEINDTAISKGSEQSAAAAENGETFNLVDLLKTIQPNTNIKDSEINSKSVDSNNLQLGKLELLDSQAEKTKPGPGPTEVIVAGIPGESRALPGNARIDIDKDGSQSLIILGRTGQAVETFRVSPTGVLSFSGQGNFNIERDGDKQRISLPGGASLVVEGNRITSARTNDQACYFLTPKEAEEKKEKEYRRHEEWIKGDIRAYAEPVINALVEGKSPAEALQTAFDRSQSYSYQERLVALLNQMARERNLATHFTMAESKEMSNWSNLPPNEQELVVEQHLRMQPFQGTPIWTTGRSSFAARNR